MNAPIHQGLYRNAPLVAGGLLGAIALLIGGIAAALQIATTGDELLPLIFGTLGVFVLTFTICMLAALRSARHPVRSSSDAGGARGACPSPRSPR